MDNEISERGGVCYLGVNKGKGREKKRLSFGVYRIWGPFEGKALLSNDP